MSHPQTRPRQISNQGQRPQPQAEAQRPQPQADKGDYVYFDRSTAGFSAEAIPKAKAAQLKLEHFYKLAVDAAVERNTRYVPHVFQFNTSTVSSLLLMGLLTSLSQACRTGTKAGRGYLAVR
jgi:hypothetical protein